MFPLTRKRKLSPTSSTSGSPKKQTHAPAAVPTTPQKIYSVCFVESSLPRFELFTYLSDANRYAAAQIDDWVKDSAIKALPDESCISIISQDAVIKKELGELMKGGDWFVDVAGERTRSVARFGLWVRSWVESLGRRRWVAKSKQRDDAVFEILVMERPVYSSPMEVSNLQSNTQPPQKITTLEAVKLKARTEESCYMVTYDVGEDGREGQSPGEMDQCFRSLEAANKLVRQGYKERVLKMEEQFYIDGMRYDEVGKLSTWLWGEFLEYGACEGMVAAQLLDDNVRYDGLNESEVGSGMLTVKDVKTGRYNRKVFQDEEVYYHCWEDRRAVELHRKMKDEIKATGDIFKEYRSLLNGFGLRSGGKEDQLVDYTTGDRYGKP